MNKKKGKIRDSAEWILAIAFVFGFMAVLIMGVWYAFNWTMQTTLGIGVLELCSRVGLAGEIVMIIVPFALIILLFVFFRYFIDPCGDIL